jgi:hypothetical protein
LIVYHTIYIMHIQLIVLYLMFLSLFVLFLLHGLLIWYEDYSYKNDKILKKQKRKNKWLDKYRNVTKN